MPCPRETPQRSGTFQRLIHPSDHAMSQEGHICPNATFELLSGGKPGKGALDSITCASKFSLARDQFIFPKTGALPPPAGQDAFGHCIQFLEQHEQQAGGWRGDAEEAQAFPPAVHDRNSDEA